MKQIQEFANKLKITNKELDKKNKYIRDSKVKGDLQNIYVEWKRDISGKLKNISTEEQVMNKLEEEFETVYQLSKKDFFEKKKLKLNLRNINRLFLDSVIIKINIAPSSLEVISSILDSYLLKIKDNEEKEFAQDAISCLSIKKRKPAIIMGWVLVMYNLYKKIEKVGFGKFNDVYTQRFGKENSSFKRAKKLDDFEYFPDQEVIFCGEDLGILDRNERRVLIDDCLKLRNMCSHPGKYDPGIKATEVFFEKIIDIVLSKN